MNQNQSLEKIGLIAGKGKFPVMVASAANKSGTKIYAIGFVGQVDSLLKRYVDELKLINLGQLELMIEYFKTFNINKVIMVGLVRHQHIFDKVRLDERAKKMFDSMKDKKADSILGGLANELKKDNIEMVPATTVLTEHLAPSGVLTTASPDEKQTEDIKFGFNIAKEIGRLDVGQTIVVKDKSVVAVESLEGTDKCIKRGGKIAGSDTVVVKVSKPQQDWRFDIPVVGSRTIKTMKKSRSKILAIESNKTIILDKEEMIKRANKYGIIVVGID